MIQRLLTLVAMLVLAACAKDAPPAEPLKQGAGATTVALHFQAVPGLNPGPDGQSTPVRVRIFELKNPATFMRSDYFALAERAPATLGPDLIDQDEVLVQPGDQFTLKRTLDPATRQVGLLVGYREVDRALWRLSVNTAQRLNNVYQIVLEARAVSAELEASPSSPAQ
ncbi:type VI secretion system lipoprotein TssJ [Pseudomonas sp. LD120]|uniref:type VI secretion system lipoprotein TssJ n=1 Tax=Pseudomonas sp. LD120 TaxID=485751 RepID=UPI00135C51BD|nr:type VI secretion system lipoprotein TssJ [Pseudomonas sp. LD120]KAF0862140.1 type VI secretion system lipoprotein TssJ [Pseudomonas sp. LD120]